MDETYTLCVICGDPIEPEAPDTRRVVEIVNLPGFGQPVDLVEGMPGLVHDRCVPFLGKRYRLKS